MCYISIDLSTNIDISIITPRHTMQRHATRYCQHAMQEHVVPGHTMPHSAPRRAGPGRAAPRHAAHPHTHPCAIHIRMRMRTHQRAHSMTCSSTDGGLMGQSGCSSRYIMSLCVLQVKLDRLVVGTLALSRKCAARDHRAFPMDSLLLHAARLFPYTCQYHRGHTINNQGH